MSFLQLLEQREDALLSGNCTGIYSSGGMGGGIVIIHVGFVTGTGTITSNGQSTLDTYNDSTGGAGAGGSIIVFANSGGLGGLTVSAIGGNGGDAWPTEAPVVFLVSAMAPVAAAVAASFSSLLRLQFPVLPGVSTAIPTP